MAFVTNIDDEQNKVPSQGAVQPGGAAVSLTPSNGIGGTGAPSGAPAANNPNAGGSFATLDKYVNANQGQAEPLAGKITAGINDQFNALQGQDAGILNNIQGQVDAGYTKADPSVLQAEQAAPHSFASNPTNFNALSGQLTAAYNGPDKAENDTNFQSQLGKINNAVSEGEAQTKTEAGRKQLLEQTEAKPTQSVTALNSAILSQDPNAQSKVENAYKPFGALTDQFNGGAQQIDTNIAGQKAQAATDASTAANVLNTEKQNTITDLPARENAAITNQRNALNNLPAVTPEGTPTLPPDQPNFSELANSQHQYYQNLLAQLQPMSPQDYLTWLQTNG